MDNKVWKRREILKAGGMFAVGGALGRPRSDTFLPLGDRDACPHVPPPRPLTAVVLGAGNRGNVYAGYSRRYPDELRIVGVAEPIDHRRRVFSEMYGIPAERQWVTWEHALQIPKFADALIITTPDHLHYGPAMGGLELGYDMILEKVIAQSWAECRDILRRARDKERIVAICHVLRYTPYFRRLKKLIDEGTFGEIVSVQHLEPVEHIHMSHSFVRGNWRNARESNPMILSKSCHDLDILRWLIGRPSRRVSSFGSLKYFRPENAPAGSPARCTDGCPVESRCVYSALKIYLRDQSWLSSLRLPDNREETILAAMREGPYGRCVFRCDNDVVDHQVLTLEFEGAVTASFSMEAFTPWGGRRTRVMGTQGFAEGDMTTLTTYDFRTGAQKTWDSRQDPDSLSGHGGGDDGLVRDFVQAASRRDPGLLTSTIEASMESHLMGFRAEASRIDDGRVLEIRMEDEIRPADRRR